MEAGLPQCMNWGTYNISTASKCCADRKEMLKLCIFSLALRLARIILCAVKSRQGLWQPSQGYPSQQQQGKSCLLSPGMLGGRGRKQGRKELNFGSCSRRSYWGTKQELTPQVWPLSTNCLWLSVQIAIKDQKQSEQLPAKLTDIALNTDF